jgi:hypothetical protein
VKNSKTQVKQLVHSQVFNRKNQISGSISVEKVKPVANNVIGYRNWIGRVKWVANRGYWLPKLDRKSKMGSQSGLLATEIR